MSLSHQQSAAPAVPTLASCDAESVRAALRDRGVAMVPGAADASLDDFEALSNALATPMVHQATSGAERDAINADATTSTVNKGTGEIELHRELSYAPGCPNVLLFYCVAPATSGGATMLCDGVALLDRLPEDVRAFFEHNRICWTFVAEPGRWQQQLRTTSQEEAQGRLAAIAAALPDYETFEGEFVDGELHGRYVTSAVIPTHWGVGRAFCNSLLRWRLAPGMYDLELENGSEPPVDLIDVAVEHAAELTQDVAWEPKAILAVDNSRWMHGRRSFPEPGRRILLRMGHERTR